MMADRARADEADLWELAGIGPGARVADVGCGPGAMLPALSDAVGPGGRVQAVDADPAAVAAARALVAAAGLANVSVAEARADHTGLAPGSLDAVMLRHVLAHNGGAEDAIVGHLASLVRPGGCVYLADADGTAVRVLPEQADLADLAERYTAFRAARKAMVTAGVATEDDVRRWERAFQELEAAPVRPTLFAPCSSPSAAARGSGGLAAPTIGGTARPTGGHPCPTTTP
jgi:SAM-dependent methyltransferase